MDSTTIMNTSDQFAQLWSDWCTQLYAHRRATGEMWIHSSPAKGVVRYHIPEWQFWAERKEVITSGSIIIDGFKKTFNKTLNHVWFIHMPDLLLEVTSKIAVEFYNDSSYGTIWQYVDSSNKSLGDLITHEYHGDLGNFESMVTCYKLTHDWDSAS